MEGYDASTYGDRFADVYDAWYADVTDVGACVAAVAELAGRGRVLELGVGTGRLALPLADAGARVVGVDASLAMLERLRAKAAGGAATVHATRGDMAALPLAPGTVDVALVAYNTLFNLGSAEAQARCVAEVGRVLAPGGAFVVEAFLPAGLDGAPGTSVAARTLEADRVVLSVTRHDPGEQTLTGQHVELTEAGGVRLRPWHLRYATPEQLDAMAADAGLALERRAGGWAGEAFDPEGAAHVSVYRPHPQRAVR